MTLSAIAATAIAHAVAVPLLRPIAATPTLPPGPQPWPADSVFLRHTAA